MTIIGVGRTGAMQKQPPAADSGPRESLVGLGAPRAGPKFSRQEEDRDERHLIRSPVLIEDENVLAIEPGEARRQRGLDRGQVVPERPAALLGRQAFAQDAVQHSFQRRTGPTRALAGPPGGVIGGGESDHEGDTVPDWVGQALSGEPAREIQGRRLARTSYVP